MKNTIVLAGIILLLAFSAHAVDQYGRDVPSAIIILPADRVYAEGAWVLFSGVGTGGNDRCGYDFAYTWSSSIDRVFGNESSVNTNKLSTGKHIIELRAVDGCKNVLSTRINVTIVPAPLKAVIVSPGEEQYYSEEDVLKLSASASGGAAPYKYMWFIDNKSIGSEETINIVLRDYFQGIHYAALIVTDSKSATNKASNIFFLSKPSEKQFTAKILSPRNREFMEKLSTNFSAGVSGGTPPYTYLWKINNESVLSKEKSFFTSLTASKNNVTKIQLAITDSTGKTATDSTELKISPVCDHNQMCYNRENYLNCPDDCPPGSQDGICDKVKDGKCDIDCKNSEDLDCACNYDNICNLGRENYFTCPSDCRSGSQDGVCDKVSDNRCDIDCKNGEDDDCSKTNWLGYVIIFIIAIVAVLVFMQLRKKKKIII